MSTQIFGPHLTGYRYLRIVSGGTPPAGWYLNGFDDSAWPIGQGGFGNVPPGDPRVVNTFWKGNEGGGAGEDLYVRLPVDPTWSAPVVNVCIDDRVVVYVGGSLWYSRPLFTGSGYVAAGQAIYDSFRTGSPTILAAFAHDDGAGAAYLDFSFTVTQKRSGFNVSGGVAF